LAKRYLLKPRGFKNSSSSISPGDTGLTCRVIFFINHPSAVVDNFNILRATQPPDIFQAKRFALKVAPTLGRPNAVALHFARRDQLVTRLAPVGIGGGA
jgi:hypothetical protein